MTASNHVGLAPVFVVRDIGAAVAWYRDVLGFEVAFVYGEPTYYAGVCRDDITIHMQAASVTTRQPGQSAANIFTADVDAYYAEIAGRGAKALTPPEDRPYGMRDFDILDPDGNSLCFGTERR
jgi:uncharacterized glyoxalase superfamily protein PhnB